MDIGYKVFDLAPSHFPQNHFDQDPTKTLEENKKALADYLEAEKQSSILDNKDVDGLILEIAIKQGYSLNYTTTKSSEFADNEVYLVRDGDKKMLVCCDDVFEKKSIENLSKFPETNLIVLKSSLDTDTKWKIEQKITPDRLFVF
ncbi:MAG: hypothetical protein HC932_01175 [Thermales bacterium]|nr:hypothetical protein [Thermales bacterium]